MKVFKFSSIILMSLLLMGVCIPELSAKHHRYKQRSSSFSLNFNVAPSRLYEPVPVYRPTYVERTTIVRPYQPVVEERVYYPAYREVIVERPCAPRVYVQPQFSFHSSWGIIR